MISNYITENNENSKLISESNIFNNKSNEKEEKKNLNKSSEKVINKSKYFKFNENKKIIPSLSCDNFIKKSKNRINNQLIKENEKNDKKNNI